MRHFVRQPQCQQHMAGIQRAGGTGAAGGSGDAVGIQQEEHTLPFNALKAEVHGAGDTEVPVAVELAVGDLFQTCDELLP